MSKNDASSPPPRIRWFGVGSANGVKFREPRNSGMHGRDWGWDATCSCGWDSHTGGAIQERVREAVSDHLFHEHGVATGIWRS